jgi:lipopolysaccharide transport system ATP-binding protein
MTVRLAFALVTAVEPDVLIIDEALAVGDQHFQKKCIERIDSFRRSGCTILFCSHSLYHVRQLCDVALWLDGGQQKAFGDTESVLSVYEAHVRAQDKATHATTEATATQHGNRPANAGDPASPARIVSVDVENLAEGQPPRLDSADLVITMVARAPAGEQPNFGVMLEQAHGAGITSAGTLNDGVIPTPLGDGLWQAQIRFTELPLHSGEYLVSVFLFDSQGLIVYEQWLHCASFRQIYALSTPGLVRLPHRWE